MKKLILLLFALPVVFFACEKEQPNNGNGNGNGNGGSNETEEQLIERFKLRMDSLEYNTKNSFLGEWYHVGGATSYFISDSTGFHLLGTNSNATQTVRYECIIICTPNQSFGSWSNQDNLMQLFIDRYWYRPGQLVPPATQDQVKRFLISVRNDAREDAVNRFRQSQPTTLEVHCFRVIMRPPRSREGFGIQRIVSISVNEIVMHSSDRWGSEYSVITRKSTD